MAQPITRRRPAPEREPAIAAIAESPPGDAAANARKIAALAIMAAHHGLWDQALAALEQAFALAPEDTSIGIDLGHAYFVRRRYQESLLVYQHIVALRPKWPVAYVNLGGLLINMGKHDLAVAASEIALRLDPDQPGAYINIASATRAQGHYEQALVAYKELLRRFPTHAAGLVDSFYLRQHLCDFDGYDEHLDLVLRETFRKGHRVPVFSIAVAATEPDDHLTAARVWTRHWPTAAIKPLADYRPRPAAERDRKLRVGYLSNDFYNHATSLLLIELLELRDRERFEVFGYSTGSLDDGTLIRQRILGSFDTCFDLKDATDVEAAEKIRADEIDILVDLKGFTMGARTDIMALRPAPIQVNFLGYPGTMGADFIDYIIADSFIVPPGADRYFAEHVVRMPECYQPNDRKRPIAELVPTRADCGLPEDGVVFCSFNAPYKITPTVFDIWMRLLARTPGSVLWVLEGFGTCDGNLRSAAEQRGIAGERIVFAAKLDTSNHLARMRLGDLFLDTYPVNAHTTASDALWTGLPIVTCAGPSMVARVAGSLLHAIGVPELITTSLAEYEAKALALAHDPAELRRLRARIESNRLTTPLFDSERYTRHYEAALLQMAALRDAGEPPRAFNVPPRP